MAFGFDDFLSALGSIFEGGGAEGAGAAIDAANPTLWEGLGQTAADLGSMAPDQAGEAAHLAASEAGPIGSAAQPAATAHRGAEDRNLQDWRNATQVVHNRAAELSWRAEELIVEKSEAMERVERQIGVEVSDTTDEARREPRAVDRIAYITAADGDGEFTQRVHGRRHGAHDDRGPGKG